MWLNARWVFMDPTMHNLIFSMKETRKRCIILIENVGRKTGTHINIILSNNLYMNWTQTCLHINILFEKHWLCFSIFFYVLLFCKWNFFLVTGLGFSFNYKIIWLLMYQRCYWIWYIWQSKYNMYLCFVYHSTHSILLLLYCRVY